MSQELATLQENVSIDKIREYLDAMGLMQSLTKAEAKQFIEIASAYGLNPFKREIYASKFGNNFSIIVGFETYLKRAERSGKLAGWSVTTTGKINWSNIRESDMVATITIHRKDWSHPFVHSVYFAEYVQIKHDGTPNKFWKEKGVTMIKKVAMAQGFRLCFSDENGGMPYTSEEIAGEQAMDAIIMESTIKTSTNRDAINAAEKLIIEKINSANDLNALKDIWDANPICKTNEVLKNLVVDRKRFIEENEATWMRQLERERAAESGTIEEHMDQEGSMNSITLF